MGDNLEKSIKQIAELLSQDEVANSLKSLLGNLNLSEDSPKKNEEPSEQREEKTIPPIAQEDMRAVESMVRAVSHLKNLNDPSANLLASVKPFLNQSRQKVVGDCVKILRMARVFEYMQKQDDYSIF